MRVRTLDGDRPLAIAGQPLPISGPKRIALVVTDCDLADDGSLSEEVDGYRRQFRCTIPLAVLDCDITHEAVREAARNMIRLHKGSLGAEDFLKLLDSLAISLEQQQQASAEPGAANDRARIERLTAREREVLTHVVAGDPNKLTAAALNISRRTVEHHRAAIMQKTGAKSVSELVRLALRTGLSTMAELESA